MKSAANTECNELILAGHCSAAGPCARAKDSITKALQMGQCWKCDTQLSHTQACLQGSSTLFTAAFWQTTQSLFVSSDQSSSSSSSSCSSSSTGLCPTPLASSAGSVGEVLWSESGGPDMLPISADMKRGCGRQQILRKHEQDSSLFTETLTQVIMCLLFPLFRV